MSFDFGDGRQVLALFMKARPGLVLRTVTDKHGRAVRRWMRPEESGSRQGRQKAQEADARRDNTPVGAVPVQFGGQTHHIVLPEREPLVMFHDSPTSEQIVINDGGLFGGIFAGPNGGMGASNRHVVVLDPDKVLSQHDLDYEIPYEEKVAALRDAMPWLDDDDLDLAYELIIEEKDMYADPDEEEDILRILRETDLGEAGWEAQRIRGAVAKRLGYQAVEMADETGTSYLVLPGAQVFPLKNKERGLRLGEASDEADEAIYEAWRKHRGDLTKSIPFDRYRASHEPTEAQLKAGTYKKPRINFQGLRIAIENPAGSVRSGKDRDGKPWEVRMIYPYGYIERSEGVDGDQVDCYVGPNPNADLVYIVHQRKYGAWDEYDEDKVMLGFDSEEDAKAAYLQHYNDPRFLGPITVMPIEEFKQKVRATREQPAMIKGMVLFFKARIGPYFRRGKLVNLAGYERKGARPKVAPGQLSLFSDAEKPAEKTAAEQGPKRAPAPGLDAAEAARQVLAWNAKRPKSGPITGPAGWIGGWAYEHGVKVSDADEAAILAEIKKQIEAMKEAVSKPAADSQPEKARKFYVTMIRDPGPRQQVSWLAGPFDTHEEALSHVDAARKHAEEVDPRAVFDAFGTTGVTADKHPPGVLNARLGIGGAAGKREKRIVLPKLPSRDIASLINKEEDKGVSKESGGAMNKEKQGAEAALSAELPEGYSISLEGGDLVLSGRFDNDLHARIKRVGGRWDGVSGTNRRVWIIPADKGASLKRVIQNWMKANREKLQAEQERQSKQQEAIAAARASAPKVDPGTYGPFKVTDDGERYTVSFAYDPDLVSSIKAAPSARFNRATKTWTVDKADGAKLKTILERGTELAEKKAAEAEELKRREAARRQAEAEERKQRGITDAFYWGYRSGRGVPSVGETVKRGDGYHVVTSVSRGRYFGEDAMSFGGTADRPYQYKVTLRRATDEEVRAARAEEERVEHRASAQRELGSIFQSIRKEGVKPERADPSGEVLVDTFDIYGGGYRLVIDDDKIWYIQNNGRDGDDWSQNNVRTGGAGAIAWYVPRSPELERKIRSAVSASSD